MHNSKDIEILTTTAEKIEFTDHDSNFLFFSLSSHFWFYTLTLIKKPFIIMIASKWRKMWVTSKDESFDGNIQSFFYTVCVCVCACMRLHMY